MPTNILFEDIHMCRISITHTICIWGYHIFDRNFEHTLQLNLPNLLLCRKIGMGEDYMDTVKKITMMMTLQVQNV